MAAASEQISAALNNPAEVAFSGLVSAFHDVTAGVIALSKHGGLLEEERASFYTLGRVCLMTSTRFNDAWTRVVDHAPLEAIQLHEALTVEARDAITLGANALTTTALFKGHAKASLCEDQISAFLDRATSK